jgi:2-oxoglutarate ferredoxin oxidoreductase subunit gamma
VRNGQTLKRFEIRLSGFGGQGILTLGRILGYGLAIRHGYYVAQTQSYGPEARGGTSRSDLVVSSTPITYPKAETLDLLVALTQEAVGSYHHYLKPSGALLVDTTLVKQTPSNVYLGLPFTELAKDKLGKPQAMNVIVLGAVSFLLPFVQPAAMRKGLEESLPPKLHAVNLQAFNLGHSQARKHFAPVLKSWEGFAREAAAENGQGQAGTA